VTFTADTVARAAPPAEPTAPVRPRRRPTARAVREALVFLAFVLPNVALIVLFTYRPLIQNIYYSTLDWTLGAPTARKIGLGNYREFFGSPEARSVLGTTAVFTVATVGLTLALGLLVAVGLNRKVRGAGFAPSSRPSSSPESASGSRGSSSSTPPSAPWARSCASSGSTARSGSTTRTSRW
jgi:ABC-type Fe3+ transport system permease subunit